MRPIYFFLLLLPITGFSLDVDEKLTFRILKISKSKKTILINRGVEDGLVEGDQAKFFDQSGVLARGKLAKIAPTRSVWSIFRVINEKDLKENKVLNLKITPEMKLTKDKSREIVPKDGVPVGVAVMDTEEERDDDQDEDKAEIEEIDESKFFRNLDTKDSSLGQGRGLVNFSPWEVVGSFSFFYSMNSIETTGQETLENNVSYMDLSFGVERYNPKSRNLWRDFSFIAFFEWSGTSMDNTSFFEGALPSDTLGFGIGANWHYGNDPFAFSKPIGFLSIGIGGGVRQFSMIADNYARSYKEETAFFSWNFGAGLKWYTMSGLGFRAVLEYFSRSGDSSFTVGGQVPRYKTAGPRFKIGASWRF